MCVTPAGCAGEIADTAQPAGLAHIHTSAFFTAKKAKKQRNIHHSPYTPYTPLHTLSIHYLSQKLVIKIQAARTLFCFPSQYHTTCTGLQTHTSHALYRRALDRTACTACATQAVHQRNNRRQPAGVPDRAGSATEGVAGCTCTHHTSHGRGRLAGKFMLVDDTTHSPIPPPFCALLAGLLPFVCPPHPAHCV